mgnify:CR=1 FL=1|tara:strand:+ start:16112 stop:17425 length:1314 start_codon:yes stop_codon:yes gene_type:complete
MKESRIIKGGGTLKGSINVPGDKSISHRALLFGAISKGITRISGLLPAEDPISTSNCLRSMGVEISEIEEGKEVLIKGVGINGLEEPSDFLDCGNSGTTMRLLIGLLAGNVGKHFVLTGDKSLNSRPMDRVCKPISTMGGTFHGRCNGKLAPISIKGQNLKGGVIGTPVASAQIKSAILLAGLSANGPTSVIEPSSSRDHSERMLKAFGADIKISGEMGRHIYLKPTGKLYGQEVVVPGDISSAAFWLVAGSIIPNSEIKVVNVGLNPTRTGILDVLNDMGANLTIQNKKVIAGEPIGDIIVKSSNDLKPFIIGEGIIPRLIDEIPILAVAACFCEGKSEINNAEELRIKETDRLAVMTRQLKLMGAKIVEKEDGLIIQGKVPLFGANLDSEGDHRVSMSLAIASILAKGKSTINRSASACISYPKFWEDLYKLLSK